MKFVDLLFQECRNSNTVICLDVCYMKFVWFLISGMNATLLYMGHELLKQPIRTFIRLEPASHAAWLGINIADTAFWVLLSYYLHHREIFLSI